MHKALGSKKKKKKKPEIMGGNRIEFTTCHVSPKFWGQVGEENIEEDRDVPFKYPSLGTQGSGEHFFF